MTNRWKTNLAGAFADDETAVEAPASGAAEAPDYAFEGYSVEFLDKVALLPIEKPQARAER